MTEPYPARSAGDFRETTIDDDLKKANEILHALLTNREAELASARKALESMLVDPPWSLDEPDEDWEVIQKMRLIVRRALTSAIGEPK